MKMSQKIHDANQFRANQKAKEVKQPLNKIVMDIAPGKILVLFFLNIRQYFGIFSTFLHDLSAPKF